MAMDATSYRPKKKERQNGKVKMRRQRKQQKKKKGKKGEEMIN